jgi:hypothetical protein
MYRENGAVGRAPPPLLVVPLPSPSRTPSLAPSLPSLTSPHGTSHGAPTLAVAALPWRALNEAVFLHGTTKTDAHDLPLAIPVLNFIQNEV